MERWLHKVHHILDNVKSKNDSRHPGDATPSSEPTTQISSAPPSSSWWTPKSDTTLRIGDFIGQGRRLGYSGLTSTILTHAADWDSSGQSSLLPLSSNWSHKTNHKLERKRRPLSWYLIAIAAQALTTTSAATAFTIAFQTPTIGLGCRSFVALLWYLLSSISWTLLFFLPASSPFCSSPANKTPSHWYHTLFKTARALAQTANALSTCLLILIMALQVTNGLNNCYCKSVIMGTKQWGGYTDLENALFYKEFFHVGRVWAGAATVGMVVPGIFMIGGLWWGWFPGRGRAIEAPEGGVDEL